MHRITSRGAYDTVFVLCKGCGIDNIPDCYNNHACIEMALKRLADIEDILGCEYDLKELRNKAGKRNI